MKIIKRYILGQFFQPFFWCLVLFIGLFWVIDLFEHIDEIVKAGVPPYVLCDYYFSLTPYIFVQISPIIMILATIYTLSNMNRSNEIMAIKAVGINLWSVINLFLAIGLLMSAASFLVNERVQPELYLHAQELKDNYFRNQPGTEVVNREMRDISFYGSGNRIFIINSYDIDRKQMNNVIISQNDEQNRLLRQIAAKRAQWMDGYWMFYDAIITDYEKGELSGEPVHHTESVLDIKETPRDIERANIQPNLMSYWRLKKYIRRLEASGFDTTRELAVFYSKTALPLANFILVFFAVPFTLTRRRESSALLGISLSVAISFSYWGVNAVSLSLGKIGTMPPLVAAWMPNLFFLMLGLSLIDSVKK